MIYNNYYTDTESAFINERNQYLHSQNFKYDLILFGDSITDGFNLCKFGGSSKKILNSAISGDQIIYMNKRIEKDVLSFNPQNILFLGGINDLREYYKQFGETATYEPIFTTILKAYESIINKTLNQHVNLIPVLILHNSEPEKNYHFINSQIDKLNKLLINLFKKYNLKYIDYNQVLDNKYGFLSRDYSDDGLHPNSCGYNQIYKLLSVLEII